LAARLGLESRVHFPGFVPQAELPALYQACDIFCLPSVTQAEAFGIVQVEAMAASKPVVGSRLGNGVEYVNQNGVTGVTVPPNDPTAFAKALNGLLKNRGLREKYGQQAKTRAFAEFSQDPMRDKTHDLYINLTSAL
jgi:rhamnosyl/mannosyltransferase